MKEKVFILEDNQERIDWFAKQLLVDNIAFTIVKTAKEAKEVLSKEKFTMLFLDHDLGDRVYVDPEDENTGTQVVRHMIHNQLQKDAGIICHSHNPVAFDSMVKPLKGNGYKVIFHPFSMLLKDVEEDE